MFPACEGREQFKILIRMNYKEQFAEWMKKNPDATIEQAWNDGYRQCLINWCNKEK